MPFGKMSFDSIQPSSSRRCRECNSVLEADEKGLCHSCTNEADTNFGGVEAYDYDTRLSYGW